MEVRRDVFLKKIEAGIEKEATFGPLVLDLGSKSLANVKTLETVRLTPKEYQILWMLMRGALIETGEIEEFLYEDHPENKDLPLSNTVSPTMGNLRKKLDDISGGTITITKRDKRGYKLILESEQGQA